MAEEKQGKHVSLDRSKPFEAILIKMAETHRRKAADYAGDFHPNQNFYDTGRQLQLTGGHAVEALISTKQARLRVLLPALWAPLGSDKSSSGPKNEPIEDTLLDRAVYSVLAILLFNEGGYARDTPPDVAGVNKKVSDFGSSEE